MTKIELSHLFFGNNAVILEPMVVVDKHSNQNDIVKEKVLLDDKNLTT